MVINMHVHSAGVDELHACSQTSHLLSSLRRQRADFQMITCFIFFLLLLPATSHEPLPCAIGEMERKKKNQGSLFKSIL